MSRARKVFTPLLALLAYALLWCLHRTLRCEVEGELPRGMPSVVVFWHGEQQLILAAHRREGAWVTLTSASADGQLQARILRRFGFECVVGSSSRGGARGLLGLVRRVRGGASAVIAADGPRGPRCVAKPGAAMLARATGAALVPVRAEASRVWTFPRAWDCFQVPKPFARVRVRLMSPLMVPEQAGRGEVERTTARLTQLLQRSPDGCQASLTPGERG